MYSKYGTVCLRVMVASVVLAGVTLISLALASGVESKKPQIIGISQQTQYRYVLTVCPVGPPTCQYKKIQDAIDAAPEDLSAPTPNPPITKILVGPGTYEENLIIRKAVALEGVSRDSVVLRPSSKEGQERAVGILVVTNVAGVFADISGFHIQRTDRGNVVSVMIVGWAAGARLSLNRFDEEVRLEGNEVFYNILENNEFRRGSKDDSGSCGIWTSKAQELYIRRNTFDTCGITVAGANQKLGIGPVEPPERVLIEENQGPVIIEVSDSKAVRIRKNETGRIALNNVESTMIEENVLRQGAGIEIRASRDIVVQKNTVEGDMFSAGITVWLENSLQRPTVTIQDNHLLRNKFGIVTESIDYITVCKGNEVKENQIDYGLGTLFAATPSPALKQKCEGN